MKIDRKKLLEKLQSVKDAINPSDTSGEQRCFRFSSNCVASYNDEMLCTCEAETGLEANIPAAPLLALLAKSKNESLDLRVKHGSLLVSGKNMDAAIIIDTVAELPDVEKPKKWKKLPDGFADGIQKVMGSLGTDEGSFVLTCAHITPDHIEACDSVQLSRHTIKTPTKKDFLVRSAVLKTIIAMDAIEVSNTKDWVHFKNKTGVVISCRSYVEKYPDLGVHIDQKGVSVKLPNEIKEACQRAEIFSVATKTSPVTIRLEGKQASIHGEGVNGWIKETIKIKYKGPDMSFRINPTMLIDTLHPEAECTLVDESHLQVQIGDTAHVLCLCKS